MNDRAYARLRRERDGLRWRLESTQAYAWGATATALVLACLLVGGGS